MSQYWSRSWCVARKFSRRSSIHFTGRLEQPRGHGDVHVLGIERALGAEAAAHVRRDDAHLVVAQVEHVEHAALHAGASPARRRRACSDCVARLVARNHAAALDEERAAAVLVDLLAKHVRRAGERAVGVADLDGKARRDVRFGARVRERRAVLQRRPAVVHRGQRLVFDFHQLRGVLRDVAAVRDHARDRLAGIAGFVLHERVRHVRLLDRRVRHEQRQRLPRARTPADRR